MNAAAIKTPSRLSYFREIFLPNYLWMAPIPGDVRPIALLSAMYLPEEPDTKLILAMAVLILFMFPIKVLKPSNIFIKNRVCIQLA